MKIASIDLGTNTALLLIAVVNEGSMRVLHDEARITRLGEKLHQTHEFIPEAQDRVLKALKDYRQICRDMGVDKIVAVGTAAFRKARNAQSFVSQISQETGITVEIISGETEARLSYLSAERDFGGRFSHLYVLDIGGGSTEIISKEGGVSFDVGAVILTESLVQHDPVTHEEFVLLKNKITQSLETSSPLKKGDAKDISLVGLAGSVTNLSAIKQGLKEWDGNKVQGSVLNREDVDGFVELFRKMTNEERKKIVGMVKGREDTILAGTLILQSVMDLLGVQEVIVSDRGLRYGKVYVEVSNLFSNTETV